MYKNSGAFRGEGMDRLRATAYLDILNEVAAAERLAYGRLIPETAPAADAPDGDAARRADGDALFDGDDPGRDSGRGGSIAPAASATAGARRPTTGTSPTTTTSPDDGEPDEGEPDEGEPDGGPGTAVPAAGAREAAVSPRPRRRRRRAERGGPLAPAATWDRPCPRQDRRSCGPPTGPR